MTNLNKIPRRKEQGVAAVEFALLLPLLIFLLSFPLFFGRIFWHYTAAHKAAHDAARYLSSVPLTQIRSPAQIANALAVATAIAGEETAELNPGAFPHQVYIQCDGAPCFGFFAPTKVLVGVQMRMDDIFFGPFTWMFSSDGVPLRVEATMSYVGN